MQKILVIGSAVADVTITLDHLPVRCEDVHIIAQKVSMGGCGFNVSEIIRHFGVTYIPFFPIGTGVYGDFIRSEFTNRGIITPIPSPQKDNGCCYCFVEADGERTFASYHGAEYQFCPEWFKFLDGEDINRVYICGLEIEEPTGIYIVEYLEMHPEYEVYFAPGPRLEKISPDLLRRIFALHPVLHLNEEEAMRFYQISLSGIAGDASTEGEELEPAAAYLYKCTENLVLITLGEKGAAYYDGTSLHIIPGMAVKPVDTNGAGDSHIGAVLACLQHGYTLDEAIAIANQVSAKVVQTAGAQLDNAGFRSIGIQPFL